MRASLEAEVEPESEAEPESGAEAGFVEAAEVDSEASASSLQEGASKRTLPFQVLVVCPQGEAWEGGL